MLRSFFARSICGILALAALTSCGSKSAGTGEFATVFATVSPPATNFSSDVVNWVDATTGNKATVGCAANSVANTVEDQAAFNLTSTQYAVPNTGSTSSIAGSPLVITRITVNLTPANSSSPVLPAQFRTTFSTAGQTILATGTPVAINVALASNQLKRFFRNTSAAPAGLGALAITCSFNPVYVYFADVTFEALEVNTNRVATISPPSGSFIVEFSDFVDK
jgi:hypothetical protein